MDEESILELRIDLHEQKLDHLATQMRDLSQSIYSMRETLKNVIEKMMIGCVKNQGTHTNPRKEANRCINCGEPFQRSLLELDKRIKLLLNSNKDHHRSTNLVGSTNLMESTKLIGEGENPDAALKGTGYEGMKIDKMVKPELEHKVLTQLEKGVGAKRSIELGKFNRPITVSKQSPQPNLLLLHRLITSKNYFINYCYEESGFWSAENVFDESPGLDPPGKTEHSKFCGVWYAVWGRKPCRPPDYMNFYGAEYALCGHEPLKPLEHADYTISSTHLPNSFMSCATPLKSSATNLLPVLESLVSAPLNNFTYTNYSQKKPAKPPYCNFNYTIIESPQPTNRPSELIICIQYYPDQKEKPSSAWLLDTHVHFVRVRSEIGYCVGMHRGTSFFVEQMLEGPYKNLVQSIITGAKLDYGMKYVAMVLAIRNEGRRDVYKLIKSDDVFAFIYTSGVILKGLQIHFQDKRATQMMFSNDSESVVSCLIFSTEQGPRKFTSDLQSVVPTVKVGQAVKVVGNILEQNLATKQTGRVPKFSNLESSVHLKIDGQNHRDIDASDGKFHGSYMTKKEERSSPQGKVISILFLCEKGSFANEINITSTFVPATIYYFTITFVPATIYYFTIDDRVQRTILKDLAREISNTILEMVTKLLAMIIKVSSVSKSITKNAAAKDVDYLTPKVTHTSSEGGKKLCKIIFDYVESSTYKKPFKVDFLTYRLERSNLIQSPQSRIQDDVVVAYYWLFDNQSCMVGGYLGSEISESVEGNLATIHLNNSLNQATMYSFARENSLKPNFPSESKWQIKMQVSELKSIIHGKEVDDQHHINAFESSSFDASRVKFYDN